MNRPQTIRCCVALAAVVSGSFLYSCDGGPTGPVVPLTLEQKIALTPRADAEAEEMALWLSGDLVADTWLYSRIKADLHNLRTKYSEGIPSIEKIRFRSVAPVSIVQFLATEETKWFIRDTSYHEWDSLNTLFGFIGLDTLVMEIYGTNRENMWVTLTLKERLNPHRLVEAYFELEGVMYPTVIRRYGDWPNIYPIFNGQKIDYLLREAWGDCPSGCIESNLYYFERTSSGLTLTGVWGSQFTGDPPEWLEIAQREIWRFKTGDG